MIVSRNEYAKQLSYKEIKFSEYEHMTTPDPLLPYTVSGNGTFLRYRINRPWGFWARFPLDVNAIFPQVII